MPAQQRRRRDQKERPQLASAGGGRARRSSRISSSFEPGERPSKMTNRNSWPRTRYEHDHSTDTSTRARQGGDARGRAPPRTARKTPSTSDRRHFGHAAFSLQTNGTGTTDPIREPYAKAPSMRFAPTRLVQHDQLEHRERAPATRPSRGELVPDPLTNGAAAILRPPRTEIVSRFSDSLRGPHLVPPYRCSVSLASEVRYDIKRLIRVTCGALLVATMAWTLSASSQEEHHVVLISPVDTRYVQIESVLDNLLTTLQTPSLWEPFGMRKFPLPADSLIIHLVKSLRTFRPI